MVFRHFSSFPEPEKSICTAGLLATIITSKFVDSMPFYRQEKQFARRGIDLSRTLMCNWTLAVWEKYRVIEEIFREELLRFPLVHADETPFQVLREEGRKVKGEPGTGKRSSLMRLPFYFNWEREKKNALQVLKISIQLTILAFQLLQKPSEHIIQGSTLKKEAFRAQPGIQSIQGI